MESGISGISDIRSIRNMVNNSTIKNWRRFSWLTIKMRRGLRAFTEMCMH